MTQQTINVGTVIGDGTGDGLHTAGQKINANFTELYTRAPAGLHGVLVADQTTGNYRVAVFADFAPFTDVANGLATLDSTTRVPVAQLPVGTSAGNIVQLDTSARLPAVDGSQLINLPAGPVPTEAQAEAGTSNALYMTPQATSQAVAANETSFRNICGRNGGFEVWQRGTSGSYSGGPVTAYYVDGWYLSIGASQNATVTQQPGLTNGSRYSARVQRASAQTGVSLMTFGFPLDSDELMAMLGQYVVLQFVVSTGANWSPTNGTLTAKLVTGTGTPVKQVLGTYANSVTPISMAQNLAAGQAATIYYSAPTLIPATNAGSAVQQAEMQFAWTPTGTAGTNDWFQVDDVQVSVVPASLVAAKPAFERTSIAWDLDRCSRFLQYCYAGFLTASSTTALTANVQFPTEMRAPPASTAILLPSTLTFSDNVSTNYSATGLAYDNSSNSAMSVFGGRIANITGTITETSGSTAIASGAKYGMLGTSGAFGFSAEI
jgi:hypothetical protein